MSLRCHHSLEKHISTHHIYSCTVKLENEAGKFSYLRLQDVFLLVMPLLRAQQSIEIGVQISQIVYLKIKEKQPEIVESLLCTENCYSKYYATVKENFLPGTHTIATVPEKPWKVTRPPTMVPLLYQPCCTPRSKTRLQLGQN